ncbi:DUF4174 domain-containing protein [Veronia pacifica]|uniref:DUF4174 domain-containing protein n=1 Tax=Veronia pacifica TaxID=1080227 RepID=A0A1C3E9M4_9GAMM|nr:DUF4174 domain-containing protein [Veronia pacifica]ODA29921.1 hypothetical protein A8L45_21190 [Veronia pacifica]
MRHLYILSGLLLALSTTSFAYPGYGQQSHTLSHRSVLFFAPSHDTFVERFLFETRMNNCELNDREVFTLVLTEDGKTYPEQTGLGFNVDVLAEQFAIPKGSHTAILIGKDGDEKHRWGSETDWQYIADLIDTMPMRQSEMAERPSPCRV